MLFHFIAARFVIKEKVYSDFYMFASCFITIALGLAEMYFYKDGINNTVIRYGLAILFLGVFAFILRNDIITLYSYAKNKFLHKSSAQ